MESLRESTDDEVKQAIPRSRGEDGDNRDGGDTGSDKGRHWKETYVPPHVNHARKYFEPGPMASIDRQQDELRRRGSTDPVRHVPTYFSEGNKVNLAVTKMGKKSLKTTGKKQHNKDGTTSRDPPGISREPQQGFIDHSQASNPGKTGDETIAPTRSC